MTEKDNVRVVKDVVEALNKHDVEGVVSHHTDDVVIASTAHPAPEKGNDVHRKRLKAFFEAFPDYHARLTRHVASSDAVAGEVEFSGTHTGTLQMGGEEGVSIPATGKKVSLRTAFFATFRDGKISEVHQYPDVAGMMKQLGLMGAPAAAARK